MIRKAKYSDISNILSLIDEFRKEGLNNHSLSFDNETLIETIIEIIKNHIILVIDSNGIKGCIAGLVGSSMFDKNQIIASERMWFVNKNYRGSKESLYLFKQFELECLKNKVSLITMVHLSNVMPEKVKNIYLKNNYKQTETHYIKKIGE